MSFFFKENFFYVRFIFELWNFIICMKVWIYVIDKGNEGIFNVVKKCFIDISYVIINKG